jgi:hypothetical protein
MQAAEQRQAVAAAEVDRATAQEREATAEVERWRALAITLHKTGEIMAAASVEDGADDGEPDAESGMNSKAHALQIVETIGGPTNIAEVAEHMQQFNRKTVAWALWKLSEERAIVKLGNGRYAPLGYTPSPVRIPPFPKRPGTPVLDAMSTAKVRAAATQRVISEDQR